MNRKPKKISTFDTRFFVFFVFAFSLYHYGVKFILIDTQYILRTPYVVASEFITYIASFLPIQRQQVPCPCTQRTELAAHLPLSSVPVLQYFDTGYTRTLFIPRRHFNTGDLVVVNNCLIGRINTIGINIASVQLITDTASCVPVVFSGINGIASGKKSHTLQVNRLQKISPSCPPETPVYTSGIDGVYPKDLLVGFVDRIVKDAVYLRCCLDFRTLNRVDIIAYRYEE